MIEAGRTIGSYRVIGLLGQGGMGAVYVAEHTLLGRKAAIKVLLPALSLDPNVVQRFFNEAKAVTQISDPGIVQVFDFGTDASGSAYIVMELLDGETVASRVHRLGTIPIRETVRLIRLVCVALHAAHAAGVIHRDLKPDNLFIVADPGVAGGQRAKVLDFGIAKLSPTEGSASMTRTGTMMGTPQYMSPEQCRGAGEIDHRSDIYSLGCVMFAMLAGRPPFEAEGTGELIVAHLQQPPPLVSSRVLSVPPILDEILRCCLAKRPTDRFASMAELAEALLVVEEQLPPERLTPVPGAKSFLRVQTGPPVPPGMITQATAGAQPVPPIPPITPTTLSSASGAHLPAAPGRRRSFVGIAAGVVVLVGGVLAVVFATAGDHSAAPVTSSGSGSASTAVVQMNATSPPPPPPDAAVAEATADAGAPADAGATIDAAPDTAIKPPHGHPGTRPHAHTTSHPTPPSTNVDRGD